MFNRRMLMTKREKNSGLGLFAGIVAVIFVLCFNFAASVNAEEELVLHYTFDEGSGQIVRDRSGHGNDGKIGGTPEWVKEKSFTALSFNGTDTYIECDKKQPSLELSKVGTLEVWCLPKTIQGGLFDWHTGSNWPDERLVLGFITWRDSKLIASVADGDRCQDIRERQETGQWTYFVLTFDGANINLYRDGTLLRSEAQTVIPDVKGVPLNIGRVEGLGTPFFHGLISEARIYNRVLSAKEVSERYVAGAKSLGMEKRVAMEILAAKQREEIATHYNTGAEKMGLDIAAAAPKAGGLVLHYTFDEGAGNVARDRSGCENHGNIFGAKWVKGPYGSALEFNGKDDYVEAPASKSFATIRAEGTISIWCRPRAVQGGIVAWNTGAGRRDDHAWQDNRLVLAVNTAYVGNAVAGMISSGKHRYTYVPIGQYFYTLPHVDFGNLQPGEWVHLALAFDKNSISAYRDGMHRGSVNRGYGPDYGPDIAGVPLRLGHLRAGGLGLEFFDGLISDVRIYNRCLSDEEILAYYEENAKGRIKDISSLGKARIEVRPYPLPEKIGVEVDVMPMRLPKEASVRVALCRPGQTRPLEERTLSAGVRKTEVILAVPDLAPGAYTVNVSAYDRGGNPIGVPSSSSFTWPERPAVFKGVKILNNFVWELLRVRKEQISLPAEYQFRNPRDGWVYIQTAAASKGGKVWVMLDSKVREDAVSMQTGPQAGSLETMRFLPAGPHVIRIEAEGAGAVSEVVVRRMPAIYYAYLPDSVFLLQFAPYDREFLWKDVLRNVNVLIHGECPGGDPEFVKEWTGMGREYTYSAGLPRPKTMDDAGVKEVYDFWGGKPGMQDPLMKGIVVDEFGPVPEPAYDIWRQAVERLAAEPAFSGKRFVAYCGRGSDDVLIKKFYDALFEGGGFVAPEDYITEVVATEAEAEKLIRDTLVGTVDSWEEVFPGSTERIIATLCSMSMPNETCNVDPSVNYKVFWDMQMQSLATHPALFGLVGVMGWRSGRCDKEVLRWIGRLYRHYAIEGRTERLSKDPYQLTHISNPDFAEGAEGWTLSPAEPESIAAKRFLRCGFYQGRYNAPAGMGDTLLWTKRSAAKPNRFSQEVKNLEPGRLYSMKMYATDFQQFGKVEAGWPHCAASIHLENVETLTGKDENLQVGFQWYHGASYKTYYYWQVFRAKGETAKLIISDWASEDEPGGPIGQELLYNFIEIQPYLEN